MKITGNKLIKTDNEKAGDSKKVGIKAMTSKNASSANPSPTAISSGDTLSLSPRAREISEIAIQLKESSDVRYDKVAHLKELIKNGTYRVSSSDVALKIIGSAKDNLF